MVTVATSEPQPLSVQELEGILRTVDPAVRLVPPRILRRVIRALGGCGGASFHVPHRKSFVCRGEQLLTVADPSEVGLPPDSRLTGHVILLTEPSPETLAGSPRGEFLGKWWRLLFHARVHREFLTPEG